MQLNNTAPKQPSKKPASASQTRQKTQLWQRHETKFRFWLSSTHAINTRTQHQHNWETGARKKQAAPGTKTCDKRLRAQQRHKTTTRHCKRRATLRLQQQFNAHTLHCWNPPTCQWLPKGGGRGNNFMHGMARPAGGLQLRHHSHWHQTARPHSLNH